MNLPTARSCPRATRLLGRMFLAVALPGAIAMTPAIAHDEKPPAQSHETKTETPVAVKAPDVPAVTEFTTLPENWNTLQPTSVTKMLREIEQRANATNPEYPVVIIDDDTIYLRPTLNHPSLRNRLYEVMKDRGLEFRWNTLSDILSGMGSLKGPLNRDAIAVRVSPDTYSQSHNPLDNGIRQSKVCVVIPALGDMSSRSAIERWLGKAGQNMQRARIDPGPYAMMLRATWHEVWHCIDRTYYRENYFVRGDPAIDNAMRMHKSEVFADVAATLTMASLGYRQISQDMGDVRAINSSWFGRDSMRGSRPTDENYYEGVTYYITRAQDLVTKHIQEVGAEAVARYTMDDIRRIAIEITEQGALNKDEFRLLADYYAQGENLITALRSQNGAGAAKIQFLQDTQQRVRAARQRLLTDTGQPVVRTQRPEDNDHYGAVDILRDMPQVEKDDIRELVRQKIEAAKAEGKRPEQGIIDLMDAWRHEIHSSTDRKPDIERKLYVLSLMLPYGQLEDLIGFKRKVRVIPETKEKAADKPVEKPADAVPVNPAVPTLPELPPGKWQPMPQEHNQARVIMRYQFKLG